MTRISRRRFFLFSIMLLALAAAPHTADAKTKTAAPAADSSPADPSLAPVSTSTPSTAPLSTSTPVMTPLPKTVEQPSPSTITAGDLTISHAEMQSTGKNIDIFFSIKNAGTADEKIGGADTPLKNSGLVQVSKDKDGKETESPIGIVLPAGKTTDLSEKTTWLRIKDAQSEIKNGDVTQLMLFFRRSPNAVLKITPGKSAKASILDWFKP